MSFDRSGKFYYLKLIRNRFRHGMILLTIRNLFTRIGLDISPYYWVQESVEDIEEPQVKGDLLNYTVSYFDHKDLLNITETRTAYKPEVLLEEFKKGSKCIGIKSKSKIAAFMFVQFNDIHEGKRVFKLKKNEAYLNLMYTYNEFRGQNLAPYLRYQCYKILEEENIEKLYSISEYFNKPAINFKKKLKAKKLALHLYLSIFNTYKWDFVLKRY